MGGFGANTLAELCHVTFDCFFTWGAVFGGVGICDNRPGYEVAGLDCGQPSGF